MKTKKICNGYYRVEHNDLIFEIRNVETHYGWEWILELVIINQPLNINYSDASTKVLNPVTEAFETTEWVNTLPTLKDCKQVILEKF